MPVFFAAVRSTGYTPGGWLSPRPPNGSNPETQRPRLSDYHLNQYQSVGLAHGAATALPGADDEQDRTFPGTTHTTIDDDMVVLNLLKQRLRQRVMR